MIKLKESQLVAMLEIAKKNPNVDVWELMSAAGIVNDSGKKDETESAANQISEDMFIIDILGPLFAPDNKTDTFS